MKQKRIAFLSLFLLAIAVHGASAQDTRKSLAEKLGFPHDAKLLIVHADDVGVTHSVNAATIKGLESGLVNSLSLMVPCPWFPEIADYAKSHPDADFGLHLTLTSERVYYRWGPVASKDKVPSLVDENGYFHHDWKPTTRINPKEVDLELRAQIDRAFAMGIRPTHLDSHHNVHRDPEALPHFLDVAGEYGLPLREHSAVRYFSKFYGQWGGQTHLEQIGVDNLIRMLATAIPEGITEMSCHPGYAEADYATGYATEREAEVRTLCDPVIREALASHGIQLISYHNLAAAPGLASP